MATTRNYPALQSEWNEFLASQATLFGATSMAEALQGVQPVMPVVREAQAAIRKNKAIEAMFAWVWIDETQREAHYVRISRTSHTVLGVADVYGAAAA